ncbi:MAG: helix-turn-helix transcriptional regulator [Romboutsia sp.]|nr:helix-turn-helix transcriptional regulator [Romboutsia sp.]
MRTLNYNDEIVYIIDELQENNLINNNLEKILKEKNITAADLSKITGLSKHRISEIINKNVIPKIDAILLIAYVLNVKVEDIFSINDFSINYSTLLNENGDILYVNTLTNKILTFKEVKNEIKETNYEYYDEEGKKSLSKDEYLSLFTRFKEVNYEKYYVINLNKYNSSKSIARKNTFEDLKNLFNQRYKKIYLKLYKKLNIYKID